MDPFQILRTTAQRVSPDAAWEALGSGARVLRGPDGDACVLVDWNTVTFGSVVVLVPGGLASWSALLPPSFTEEDIDEEVEKLRERLERYIDSNPVPLSRTVEQRAARARIAYAALWETPRVPERIRPPGHTCPTIDKAQASLRRLAWRLRPHARTGTAEREQINALVREGLMALERVRHENRQMREAYWSVQKKGSS